MSNQDNHLDKAIVALAMVSLIALVVSFVFHLRLRSEFLKTEVQRSGLREEIANRNRKAGETATSNKLVAANDSKAFPAKVVEILTRLEDPRFASAGQGRIAANYGMLFARLKLSDEKLNRIKKLCGERMDVTQEVVWLARAEDLVIDDLPDRKDIIDTGNKEIDDAIAAELGPDDFKTFQVYQLTLDARRFMIQPFADHLALGASPLSDSQVDSLAMAASEADFGVNEIILRPPGPPIPASLDSAVSSILNADQQQAFVEYKAVWAAKLTKSQTDVDLYLQRRAAQRNGNGR